MLRRTWLMALLLVAAGWLPACQTTKSPAAARQAPVWQSAAYTLYRDSVVQGSRHARATSATELASNYQSLVKEQQSPQLTFKFSLNGQDSELGPNQYHRWLVGPAVPGDTLRTPVFVFGQPDAAPPLPVPTGQFLAPNTPITLRVDMRPVLDAFKQHGFYTTYKGEQLRAQDFKQVFVLGSPLPLTRSLPQLAVRPDLALHDPDGNGIYEVTLLFNAPQREKPTWQPAFSTADFPQYHSDYPLADALYNLALEEARRAVEPDSTFRTGQEWAGVWTRDISYSILLAQATLQPKVAMKSLLRKVSPTGRIIQDTGTGGSYPCSTDRVIWAVAAWEIYKVTGDEAWLRTVYPIIQKTLDDDAQNVYDPATGLARGESSFLDWREQTYPRWMQPADIYQSLNLGTNAVHFQAQTVLACMARQLGKSAVALQHEQAARRLKAAINELLWLPTRGYYGQYLYGRTTLIPSPRAEALGEALSVWFNLADAERAKTVVSRTPTVPFGIPCIYPQIPNIPAYHNDAVWPFVQAFWALAAAKAGNEASLTESIAAIYRPAALFLTNKENFVAATGDFAGTQINSSNMLWSLSGSLSLVYKILFGMRYETDRLVFHPSVPQAFAGDRTLTGFTYRQAVLDIDLHGFGTDIAAITLDGRPLLDAAVPATLTGRHRLHIELRNQASPAASVNRVANRFSPETPGVTLTGNRLSWPAVVGATQYRVLRNGIPLTTTTALGYEAAASTYAEYQVIALGADGLESFASEPLPVGSQLVLVQLETQARRADLPYHGFTGEGFVEISPTSNPQLPLTVTVPATGTYALDFRYANGNGPLNTNNMCAIRTLRDAQGQQLGTIVLPQRGNEAWSNWGFTNSVLVPLHQGINTLRLDYEPANRNMSGAINQALLDYVRLLRMP